jgi:hypothetical protein
MLKVIAIIPQLTPEPTHHSSFIRKTCVRKFSNVARPRVADRGDGLQIWRVAANILNEQSRTADSGWSSSLGVGRWVTTLPRKTQYLLRTTTHSLGTGRITWHNLSTGKWILGTLAWGVWIGFDCLRTGAGGRLLWVRWWIFGFLRHGVSYLAKERLVRYCHVGNIPIIQ